MAQKALTQAQVIAGEAVSGDVKDRFDDMVAIASVVANRAKALNTTPEDVVSVQKQFNAYGKPLDKGRAAYVGLAQAAIDKVAKEGPVHKGTFYATPAAYTKIGVPGLTKEVQTKGHIFSSDPKNRAIETASGLKTPNAVASSVPTPSARPAPGLVGVSPTMSSYAAGTAPAPRNASAALAGLAAGAPAAGPLSSLKQGPMAAQSAPASIQANPLGFTSSPVALGDARVTSNVSSARKSPADGRTRAHNGVDIAGAAPGEINGRMMTAVRDGTVISAGKRGTFGNQVVVDHGLGLTTSYNHMGSISVKKGDVVGAASPLGTVGTTGRSTGPHVHFEARINGKVVDPAKALSGVMGEDLSKPRVAPTDRAIATAPAKVAARVQDAPSVAPRVATASVAPRVAAPAPAARQAAPVATRPAAIQAAPARAVTAAPTPAAVPATTKTIVGKDVTAQKLGPMQGPQLPSTPKVSPAITAATTLPAARATAPKPAAVAAPTPSVRTAPTPTAAVSVKPAYTAAPVVANRPAALSPVATKPATLSPVKTTTVAAPVVTSAPIAAKVAPTVAKAAAVPTTKTIVGQDVTPKQSPADAAATALAAARAAKSVAPVQAKPVPSFSALMAESNVARAKAKVAAPVASKLSPLPAPKTVAPQPQVMNAPRAVAAAPAVASVAAAPRAAAPRTATTAGQLGAPAVPDAPSFTSQAMGKISNTLSNNKGKMLGSVIGSMVAGPVGAMIGGFLGNKIQNSGKPQPSAAAKAAMDEGTFDGFSHGVNQNQGILASLFGGNKSTGLGAPSVPNAPTGKPNYSPSKSSGGPSMSSTARSTSGGTHGLY